MLPEFNSSGLSIYGVINSDNAIFPIRNTSDIDDADTVVLNYERDDSTTVEPSCGIALVLLQWLGNTANTLVKIDDVRSTDNCYELIRCFYGIGLSLKTADYDIGRLQSGDDPNTIDGSAPFDNNICECANQLGQESASCYFESHPHSNDGSKCTNYLFSSPYQSWRGQSVDMNMQTFVRGGFDSFGIFWPGQNGFGEFELYKDGNPNITRAQVSTNYSLSTSMGKQMSGTEKFQCSLETQCQPSLQCGTVGSSIATGLGAKISILQWPLLAMISLVNINQQLKNQYDEIAKATIQDTLRSFDVKVFYPQPKNHFALSNILQGLTSAFAILAGFVPGVEGVALATSSAAVGAVGAYLGRYIDSNSNSTMDPNPAQEKFADTIVVIYDALLDGLDHLAKDIFRGDDVLRDFNDSTLRSQYPSGFGLLEMMKNGTWVDDSVLPNLTNSREQLAIEILSRGIDDLWKTPSHNKIFVTFQDLKDTKGSTANCMADSSGPPSFKYCDDNGVYYAYNFVEDGPGQGHLDWPWGAKMLNTSFKIDASWVTEASAKTYRAAKTAKLDNPFSITATTTNAEYNHTLLTDRIARLDNFAGRSAGSWTLPVCDTSTWGSLWNHDYTGTGSHSSSDYQVLPCLCGPRGTETKNWIAAAGMFNFQTYYKTCSDMLTTEGLFTWPDKVTSVDFGFGKVIHKPR